jgi:hypothetical protein
MADTYNLNIIITHGGELLTQGVFKDHVWNTIEACKDYIQNSTEVTWYFVKNTVERLAVIRGDEVEYACLASAK